jgi:hypothetical protein
LRRKLFALEGVQVYDALRRSIGLESMQIHSTWERVQLPIENFKSTMKRVAHAIRRAYWDADYVDM